MTTGSRNGQENNGHAHGGDAVLGTGNPTALVFSAPRTVIGATGCAPKLGFAGARGGRENVGVSLAWNFHPAPEFGVLVATPNFQVMF